MQCKICGCTDEKPCMTAEGPCHWILPGLCSECVVGLSDGEHSLKFKGTLMLSKRCKNCAKLELDQEAVTMGFSNHWRCTEGRFDEQLSDKSIIPGCYAWSTICKPGKAVAAAQRKCPSFEVHPKWRRHEEN
jgi:hypothetical protein